MFAIGVTPIVHSSLGVVRRNGITGATYKEKQKYLRPVSNCARFN
jgi:hypothetical protein